jgi:hypothetical protein
MYERSNGLPLRSWTRETSFTTEDTEGMGEGNGAEWLT